jgi:RNA polymerase sigma-70 factor (ECF subfamily)
MTETPIYWTDERRLLAAARAGDERAFGRLVDRHRPGLELFCSLMVGCPREAEELVGETVLRAWRERERVERRASARSWLYRIAVHACLDELERADELRG